MQNQGNSSISSSSSSAMILHGGIAQGDLPDNEYRPVIKCLFESMGMVQANVDSYNRLIEEDMETILEHRMPIVTKIAMPENSQYHTIRVEKYLLKPQISPPTHRDTGEVMLPITAFNDKHNYSSDVLVQHRNVIIGISSKGEVPLYDQTTTEPRRFTRLPTMLRSSACYTHRKDPETLRRLSEDPYDHGGYFIVDSKETVVISQDEKGSNIAYINYRKHPKDAYECTVKSRGPKMVYTDTPANFKITLNNRNQTEISINLWNGVPIPLILVFQALGVVTDRRIAEYVINDVSDAKLAELLLNSFDQYIDKYRKEANGYESRAPEETIEFWALYTIENLIKTKKKLKETDRNMMVSEMRRRITEDLLPHLGDNNRKKAMFIGYYVKRLFRARLGLDREDDVYNYGNRRINTPGILFGMVVDQTVRMYGKEFRKKLLTDAKENLNIKINDIIKHLEDFPVTDKIENNINSTLRNGSWILGSAYYKSSKSKISMAMERKSRMDPLAMCRKVSTGVGKGNVSNKTRQLHQSIVRYLCLAETPEGGNIGLFKHYALTAWVTVNNPTETRKARELLEELSGDQKNKNGGNKNGNEDPLVKAVDSISPVLLGKYTKIFLNNDLCYVTEEPIEVRQRFIDARRKCDLTYTEVIYDYLKMEIRIWTDHGRIMTPIYIVNNDKKGKGGEKNNDKRVNELRMNGEIMGRVASGELSWYDLLAMGVVEYIGIHEQQFNCVVAVYPSDLKKVDPELQSYTHCEIHPSVWMGVTAGLVPFSSSNPSPRLVFQSAMGKQAMDIYNVNFHNRYDTFVHMMPVIERPLTTTYYSDLCHYVKLPSGRNAIVGVLCYEGYNMEDSLMVNQSFVDRWGFTSVNYKTINVDMSNARQQQIAKPNPANTTGFKKTCSYDVIDKTGYPIIGKIVRKGDIVVGMVQRTAAKGKYEYVDKSVEYNEITPGVIDSILTSPVHNDHLFTKIRVRTKKGVVSGDKLCCHPSHQVLTTVGWVNVAELTVEHEVATLNQETQRLEYQKPTAVHEYDHDGDMVLVESKQVNQLVTPNHKMYVAKRPLKRSEKKYQLIEASELIGKRIWYKKNADWIVPEGEEPEVAVLSSKSGYKADIEVDIEPWLMFYGLWTAEGSISRSNVTICVHKRRVRETLIGCLNLMKIEYKIYKSNNANNDEKVVTILNTRLRDTIAEGLSDIPEIRGIYKKLPDWVWSLNKRQCRILLQGMLLGDGSQVTKNEDTSLEVTYPTPEQAIAEYKRYVTISQMDHDETWRYDTSSWRLKDDVMRLALHCGWAANPLVRCLAGSVRVIGKKSCKSNATAWRLTLVKGQVEPEINKPQPKGKEPLNQCRRVQYTGKVYCCTVPNGVFYTRRVKDEDTPGDMQLGSWTGNSSFNGQKGTLGLVYPTAQFPYYDGGVVGEDGKVTGGPCAGMVPDLIMNPHAFPSRMTIGQNIQGICNLLAALTGITIDGSAFNGEVDLEKVYAVLEKHGFNRHGNFAMRCGVTGEPIPTMIFSTPVYYQRLKHIVDGKLYVRSVGARQRSTRQPLAGKNRGGGVRLGLMERDVLIAHGASLLIREKFLLNSDPYSLHVCQDCGHFAPGNPRERFYKCIRCRKSNRICQVVLPYATKRFIQEVTTLNIPMRLIVA